MGQLVPNLLLNQTRPAAKFSVDPYCAPPACKRIVETGWLVTSAIHQAEWVCFPKGLYVELNDLQAL